MKTLLSWPDVLVVVKTIIENDYDLREVDKQSAYEIEKITDRIFTDVRKRQLEDNLNLNP